MNLNFLSPNEQKINQEHSLIPNEIFHDNGQELSLLKVDAFANSKIIYLLKAETRSKEYIFAASQNDILITDLIDRLKLIIDKFFSDFSTENSFCGEKISSQIIPAYFFVRSPYSLYTSIRYKEILSLDEKINSVFPSKSSANKNRKVEIDPEIPSKGYFEVPIFFNSQSYIPNSFVFPSDRPKSPDPKYEVSYNFGFSEDIDLMFDQ